MTKKERVLKIFLCAVCLFAVVFSVFRPKVAADAAFSALSLCATRVVPSLFLFMAAAKMLAKCGGAALFSKITHGAFERLFGVSESGAAVIFLGLLSGYPAGAVVAGEYLASGKMERAEAERILPFATAASPAFLVGTVGSMFGSARFGAVLLAAQVFSALILLLLTRRKGGAVPRVPEPCAPVRPLSAATAAIKECGVATLAVCSFVTFFYIFSAMLLYFLPESAADGVLGALLSGVLEISCGFSRLAAFGENYFLGGLVLGFGGFSVFMQTADALGDAGVSLGKYAAGKCVQALLCGALASLFGAAFGKLESVFAVFLFGGEQAKIAAIWETAVIFLIFAVILGLILALILKIFSFFSKK